MQYALVSVMLSRKKYKKRLWQEKNCVMIILSGETSEIHIQKVYHGVSSYFREK